ncbi:hypothetical protein PTKIN_Ptkin08bG0116900 [Pterospermum kingtungense]
MEQTLPFSLASLLFLLVAIKFLIQTNKNRNLPPSPFALPILGHLHLLKEPLHRTLFSLSQKYGPIFSLRFGSRLVVIITSPSAVEECFSKNVIILANRPRLTMGKYVAYNYTTLGTADYGGHWRILRLLTTLEIFSSSRLNMSSNIRRDEISSLISRLYHVSVNGFAKVELKTMFSELTFNIIMRMIAGKRYYGDEVGGTEEAREFHKLIEEIFELAVSSYPGDFLPLLSRLDYNGYIKKVKEVGKKADDFAQVLIDEHRRNKGDLKLENSMISHLLALQESQPEYYSDEIIKDLVLVMCLYFLQAAPLLVPHVASDHCTIGGYEIPTETIVLVNSWAIQRDPELWDDSTSFKPERFEGKEGEAHKLMPFGLGRRACPGMGLGHRVLGVALGSLIQCFEWERLSEKEIDMTEGKGLTMPKVEPLEAMCKPRHITREVLLEVN